ncbi:hypothetical protein ACPW96_22560 [Micromonospora sp. DT81.3]|uniref:hypothetical protein n=1 Tax=Micromonospora sp. DT81.3 TaxID=3416523 RepID=UPI003CF67B88
MRTHKKVIAPCLAFAALVLVTLTAASCASKVDDVARALGVTADEAKIIIGAQADNAESTATRWLDDFKKFQPDEDIKLACGLLLDSMGVPSPIPRTDEELRSLLQFVVGVPEATAVQSEVSRSLIVDSPSPGLGAAIEAFRIKYCPG